MPRGQGRRNCSPREMKTYLLERVSDFTKSRPDTQIAGGLEYRVVGPRIRVERRETAECEVPFREGPDVGELHSVHAPPVREVGDPLRIVLEAPDPFESLLPGDPLLLLDRVDHVVIVDDRFRVPLDLSERGQQVGRRHDPALVVDHDEGTAPAVGAPVEIPAGDHHRPGKTGRPPEGMHEHGGPSSCRNSLPPCLPAQAAGEGNPYRRGEDTAAGPPSAPVYCPGLLWIDKRLPAG